MFTSHLEAWDTVSPISDSSLTSEDYNTYALTLGARVPEDPVLTPGTWRVFVPAREFFKQHQQMAEKERRDLLTDSRLKGSTDTGVPRS